MSPHVIFVVTVKEVPVRELKANLSKYLHLAEGGEPVMVKNHGRAMTLIVSIAAPQAVTWKRLADLVHAGAIRLPTRPKTKPKLLTLKGKPLTEIILEEREE